MSGILDDMDSRPGSATSLLRTVIGLYARDFDGWMAVANIIELMDALGVPEAPTRTALTRVKSKGVLRTERRAGRQGYALEATAQDMLERGDRRIFGPRIMQPNDLWCVISSSLPEHERNKRLQLRRRLHWIGCGHIGPGLAVCPDFLRSEVLDIVRDLEIADGVTLLVSRQPIVAGKLSDAVAKWWDLGSIAHLHSRFIVACEELDIPSTPTPRDSFVAYVRSIDTWRMIPYLDPGLPTDLLPTDWPGGRSINTFAQIRGVHESASSTFVNTIVGTAQSGAPD